MACPYRPIQQHCFNKEPKYKFQSLIGNGSFGCVFKALDLNRNIEVAIKRSLKVGSLISREFKILKEISTHCNCVHLLDIFYTVDPSHRFVQHLVFEYLPDSLDKFLSKRRKANRPVEPVLIRDIMKQILTALDFLHSRSILHRDLKPENILLNPLETPITVKLCDFGSSKKTTALNTPYIVSRFYRAPELIFCNTSYGTEVDIWSAGCIFVELYLSRPLFVGENEGDQYIKQAEILGPPNLSDFTRLFEASAISPEIAAKTMKVQKLYDISDVFHRDPDGAAAYELVTRMLSWNPDNRPSAKECLESNYFKVCK